MRNAVLIHQDVVRFDVPMHNARPVDPRQGFDQGQGRVLDLLPGSGKRAAGERLPVDEFHDQKRFALVHSVIEQSHNAGQAEQSERVHFQAEGVEPGLGEPGEMILPPP